MIRTLNFQKVILTMVASQLWAKHSKMPHRSHLTQKASNRLTSQVATKLQDSTISNRHRQTVTLSIPVNTSPLK